MLVDHDDERQRHGDLTTREFTVLQLAAESLRDAEIAARLLIGVRTVKHHMSTMRAKLGARDRAHAVALGFQLRLLRVNCPEGRCEGHFGDVASR